MSRRISRRPWVSPTPASSLSMAPMASGVSVFPALRMHFDSTGRPRSLPYDRDHPVQPELRHPERSDAKWRDYLSTVIVTALLQIGGIIGQGFHSPRAALVPYPMRKVISRVGPVLDHGASTRN